MSTSNRTLNYVDAIREATEIEMTRDDKVVMFGLDVDDPKGEDKLLVEMDKLRKNLSTRDNQLLQRLFHSIGYVEPKDIEIDEADPGSAAW